MTESGVCTCVSCSRKGEIRQDVDVPCLPLLAVSHPDSPVSQFESPRAEYCKSRSKNACVSISVSCHSKVEHLTSIRPQDIDLDVRT